MPKNIQIHTFPSAAQARVFINHLKDMGYKHSISGMKSYIYMPGMDGKHRVEVRGVEKGKCVSVAFL